jgi:hypothetical protein
MMQNHFRESLMRTPGIRSFAIVSSVIAGLAIGPSATAAIIPGTIINYDIGASLAPDGNGDLQQNTYTSVDFDNDASADYWNAFGDSISSNTDYDGATDIDGNPVDVTLRRSATGTINRSSGFPNTVSAWNKAHDVPDGPVSTIYFIFDGNNSGTETMTFTLKGAGGVDWDVEVFSMISTAEGSERELDIQVNGLFANGSAGSASRLEGDGFQRHEEGAAGQKRVLFEDISPDANGRLIVTITHDATTGNPTVNALRFTAVPEPGTAALLIAGLIGVLPRRRRR